MSTLIVNTMSSEDEKVQVAIREITAKGTECQVIHTEHMQISPCMGCNSCWLKTPGICPIKDDYEQIMTGFLQYDQVIFLTETKLGFISYKTKNLFDRILPLATMYLCFMDGQMRHVLRYKKTLQVGILYEGEADQEYLNHWLYRAVLNMHGESLGAFPISEGKGAFSCIW